MRLDLAKPGCQRRAENVVQAAVKDFAAGAQAQLAVLVIGPIGSDEDIALDIIQILLTGEKPVQYRSDTADFLNRFVCDMDDSLHRITSLRISGGKVFL